MWARYPRAARPNAVRSVKLADPSPNDGRARRRTDPTGSTTGWSARSWRSGNPHRDPARPAPRCHSPGGTGVAIGLAVERCDMRSCSRMRLTEAVRLQCLAATGLPAGAVEADRSAAVDVVTRVVAGRTAVADVIEQMLAPAQVEVGIRAQRDHWSVADEHAATAITEVVLGVLALRQPAPVARSAPVCVTTPAGRVAWTGRADGRRGLQGPCGGTSSSWAATYLATTSGGSWIGLRPAAVLLAARCQRRLPAACPSLEHLSAGAGVPTIVGGSALQCGCWPSPGCRRERVGGGHGGGACAAQPLDRRRSRAPTRAPCRHPGGLPRSHRPAQPAGETGSRMGQRHRWRPPVRRPAGAGGPGEDDRRGAELMSPAASLLVDDARFFDGYVELAPSACCTRARFRAARSGSAGRRSPRAWRTSCARSGSVAAGRSPRGACTRRRDPRAEVLPARRGVPCLLAEPLLDRLRIQQADRLRTP